MEHIFKFSIFVLTFFMISCSSQNNSNHLLQVDDYSAKIDSLIQITKPRKFNGVVLITQNGEIKYSKAYGYSNFEDKTPINKKDNFRIQSNSKQITAVLILKEVEHGKIDLNSSIKKYLPEIKQTWADTVTIHQLLNMSSGIIGVDKPLLFKPGKGYKYSNTSYGLLGRIIEKVTGNEYTKQANNLFKELGMDNSYCYEMNKANNGLINGYWLENEQVDLVEFESLGFTNEEWRDFIPAGGIISNAHDLNIWDIKLHKGKILNSNYYKQMITSSNLGPHAAFDNDTVGYGYGLRIHDRHPTNHLGHGGRGIGFVSIKFYIPEKEVNAIIWENVYSRDGNGMSGDVVYYFENEIRKIIVNSNLTK